jgi:large subunit ribosomal protein L4e
MFAPTKVWRKWHRKINTNQKRFAVASALAASALPGLVFARGHNISTVPEIPLVLDSAVETLQRTKQAIATLKAVGAYDDVMKAKSSRKLRCGKGKLRDRRHVQRRGPLVVYAEDNGVVKAFRNLPGVEVAHVDSLNLLQLAPGGHLGRFVIWSRAAFSKLSAIWGSTTRVSSAKKDYTLPRPVMHNSDLTRIINSDEIQSKVRPAIKSIVRRTQKKNPLVNLGARIKLNPYAAVLRRSELLAAQRRAAGKAKTVDAHRKNVIAANKKHQKQQAINYHRIADDDFGKPAVEAAAEEKKEE